MQKSAIQRELQKRWSSDQPMHASKLPKAGESSARIRDDGAGCLDQHISTKVEKLFETKTEENTFVTLL